MFARKDVGAPNGVGTAGSSARDGSHCDLCGCTRPAVRCDKCNRQVFCLSCDDMYHRHPRRKSHLRRAVDSVASGRTATVKPPHSAQQRVEGDPSHMPVPPPRKKKSLFSAFGRGPPASHPADDLERHPALPKKEFSWTDKFGSIKRFMASRPLPPVPPEDEGMPPSPRYHRDHVPLNYVNVDPHPPAVPQRPPPRIGFPPPPPQQKQQHSRDRRETAHMGVAGARNDRMTTLDDWDDVGSASGSSHASDDSWGPEAYRHPGTEQRDGQAFRKVGPPSAHQAFGTLRKHSSPHAFAAHKGGDSSTLSRQSSSMTDLHGGHGPTGAMLHHGPGYPAAGPAFRAPFGYHPMAYPLASATPLGFYRPPFLGGSTGSWSNVNSAAEDGKETDDDKSQRHSTLDCRRIKRSQSCMQDPMMHPAGPFYPFGYPAYPPMFPPWMRPPSPSLSQHSLPMGDESGERLQRPHHRKHKKSLSKTTSRRQSSQDLSSEEENDRDSPSLDERSSRDRGSHSSEKVKSRGRTPSSRDREEVKAPEKAEALQATTDREHSEAIRQQQARLLAVVGQAEKQQAQTPTEQPGLEQVAPTAASSQPKWDPTKPWRCQHCTFINEAGSRICLICCKTTFREQSPAPVSDDEERQKKRAGFQDTLADKEIELPSTKSDADPAKSEPDPAESKPEAKLCTSTDDNQEIRRRLEIQMRIEEENRRIEIADVVQESRTVQHFQGDNAETESSSLTPQQALALSAEAEPSPSTHSSATATTAQTGSSYHSNIQQCNSSSQTMSVGDEPSPATSDSLLLDATSPVTMQGVRPKVLYKASVATDTEDFTDPSTSSPLSDSQQDRQERHRIFTNAKAQSFDHPRPAFLQPKGAQPVVRGTRIGNLIRTLSKTSLQNTEPEGRLYRSHSRSSLHSDMSDASPMRRGIARHGSLAEFDRPFGLESNRKDDDASSLVGATSSSYISEGRKQDYYLSLEELVQQRKQEQMRTQGLELVRLIREAEQRGFTADDLQVAMNHCGNDNPINWLRDNWQNMTETVVTLATNYGHDRRENTIGIVSVSEAQNALRRQKGNIWAAVTECVENRQRMFMELSSRGNFTRQEILAALTDNQGNMDMAYAQLTKATLKPFLMRIWGPGTGVDNDEGRRPSPLGDKREESVTDRVKDWLESLDAASQLPSSNTSSHDERRGKRHSFHGHRSDQSFCSGNRDRSSSPASSFSSLRETSEVSSVSSAVPGGSSRLEAILRRREAQKEFEKDRKSKKEANADGSKRRWTLASVFSAKKSSSPVKKDAFTEAGSSAQKSSSQTTLASDTTQLDSSSSGEATESIETLTSIEATGAKPKTFLGRFSSLKNDSRKKDTKATEAAESGASNNSVKGSPMAQRAAETLKDESDSKTVTIKETNTLESQTPNAQETKQKDDANGDTTPFAANRNAIENIKQSIHAAKISFMSAPPGAAVQHSPEDAYEQSDNGPLPQNCGRDKLGGTSLTKDSVEKPIENHSSELAVGKNLKNEMEVDTHKGIQLLNVTENTQATVTKPSSSPSESKGTSPQKQPGQSPEAHAVSKNTAANAICASLLRPRDTNVVNGADRKSMVKMTTTEALQPSASSTPTVVIHHTESSAALSAPGSSKRSSQSASSECIPVNESELVGADGNVKAAEYFSMKSRPSDADKDNAKAASAVNTGGEGSTFAVTKKLGNHLADTASVRRHERPLTNGTAENVELETLRPPTTAGKGGPLRRPSVRRVSRESADECVVRDRDGNALIVKPQKPIERRGSVNARSGLQISKAVAANIAKLRSVPPPRKRKQVVQPRPAGKLPTEKQKQYKAKAEELVQGGRCPTMVHAHLVAELIDMSFDEEDAILAAEQCESIYQAVNFLQQECELCAANYPISQMVSLLNCVHRACKECLKAYFTIQIRDRNIMELLCPFCNEPDLSDEDVELNYFNNLDILLKGLVDSEVYDLFQQKLRDRALMKDPNFRWCSQCSSGFITYPNQIRLACPDCKAVTCASCRKPWQKQHEGISCEQFQEWQQNNDPESQAEGIAQYLAENGIDCPNCKFRYALARGGCMHFKCYQCGFDFCCGCNLPFKMGEKCGRSPNCSKLGLHAHHPRNCLFYLRDKKLEDLQRLLEESNIAFNRDPPAHWVKTSRCQVPEQKETRDGFKDDVCGRTVEEGTAGLCRMHYVEYLGQLIFKSDIDPVPIFDVEELELVLKRANIRLPSRYKLSDREYQDVLIKVINTDVPLEKVPA
ncbi:uncharacterized protein LOC119176303 isoform X2 [Rhipicephalus microplus]|uniref:uncharacterized protein LOC119176303 isoform X2 n=1 Tax=Rhipicephalus microplus TaxID=6941 RepID=UPI003F6B5A1D